MTALVSTDVFGILFQTMVHELKNSSSAWDNACSRAVKLSIQLNSVANCLGNFVDTIQVISDNANNIKGASRDIGAALTRFCMRQKSIENCIRSLAIALSEQFAPNLEKKSAEWRHKIQFDFEKRRTKMLKKSSKRKTQVDFIENRNSYSDLLFEQRDQFVHFVNLLLPVINVEVNLLEENSHVLQVRDSIEATVNGTNSNAVVQALLEDLSGENSPGTTANNPDSWHRKITQSKESCEYQSIEQASGSTIVRSPTMRKMSESVTGYGPIVGSPSHLPERPHTISASQIDGPTKRVPISAQTYIPPPAYGGQFIIENNRYMERIPASLKPPLPRRQVMTSGLYLPPRTTPSTSNINDVNNHILTGHALSISANDLSEDKIYYRNSHTQRPISLIGCDINEQYLQQHFRDLGQEQITPKDKTQSDRCSTSLIAETLQQIDQLGVELDSYCQTLKPSCGIPLALADNTSSGVGSSNASMEQLQAINNINQNANLKTGNTAAPSVNTKNANVSNVRYRPDNIRPPPPLPQRRNSTITAATPTAPSIADIRCSFNGVNPDPTSPTNPNKFHHRTFSKELINGRNMTSTEALNNYAPTQHNRV